MYSEKSSQDSGMNKKHPGKEFRVRQETAYAGASTC